MVPQHYLIFSEMRIDIYLVESGMTASRTEAKRCIEDGRVTVNGVVVTKPSYDISGVEDVSVLSSDVSFVGRGGIKLEGAIKAFDVQIAGKLCLDIGASSGGFTDCLLQHSARKIYAVDVGESQLHEKIAENPCVIIMDGTNARYLNKADFEEDIDGIVTDVSFISLRLIFPKFFACSSNSASIEG